MEDLIDYLAVYVIANILCYVLYLGLYAFFVYDNKSYKHTIYNNISFICIVLFFPLYSLWCALGMIYRIHLMRRFRNVDRALYERVIHAMVLLEKGYINIPMYLEQCKEIYSEYNQIISSNKKV